MKTRRDTLIILGGATTLPLVTAPANASVAGFGGSTEITQILNNIQLLGNVSNTALTAARTATSLVNQGLQIANQLNAYANMIQNTLQIPNQLWAQIKKDIGGIFDNVSMAQGISIRQANIDQIVRDRFWSVDEYRASTLNRAQLDQRFTSLGADLDVRVEETMRNLGLVSEDNMTKSSLIGQIEDRLVGANGAVAIAKESAQLSSISAQTLLKLSEQAARQAELTTQYREVERDRENQERAQQEKFVKERPAVTPIGN